MVIRGSWSEIAAVVVTILLISGAVGSGVQLGNRSEAVSGFVGSASAQQSGHIQVENPARDNVDQDGNTGVAETEDDDSVYGSIQAGVANASDTARVEVAPGTYRAREVRIAKNITLIATGGPEKTILNGSQFNFSAAISGDGVAAPVIAGFSFTAYDDGITAFDAAGDWTVRNSTFRNTGNGINAPGSSGNWTIRDSTFGNDSGWVIASGSSGNWTIRNSTFQNAGDVVDAVLAVNSAGNWTIRNSTFQSTDIAVGAFGSSGDWTIRNSTFENNNAGIVASDSSGNWTVRNSTFQNAGEEGVVAVDSSGDWTIRTSTFENNSGGVFALNSSGDWTVRDSTVQNNTDGVYTVNSSGVWDVHQSVITNNTRTGIDATNAAPRANATDNYWGQASGPTADQCVGNVTCTPALSSPPDSDTDHAQQPSPDVPSVNVTAPETVPPGGDASINVTGTDVEEIRISGDVGGWIVNSTDPSTVTTVPSSEETPYTSQSNDTWEHVFSSASDSNAFNLTVTAPPAAGTYNFTAEVTNGSGATATESFSVEVSDASASFGVSNLDPMDLTATQGDVITVSANVTNTGGLSGTQTVEFRVGGTELASQSVSLNDSETTTVEFTGIDTSALAPGNYTYGVYTADGNQTATLAVENATTAPDVPGVSEEVASAFAGDDGTIERSDVLAGVRAFINQNDFRGASVTRADMLNVVQYFIKQG